MPKFAIGDVVDKDKTHYGTVIAVFTTMEGQQRYAVDMEGYGALQFITECNLVPHETAIVSASNSLLERRQRTHL
jgi:hypothetical protein